MYIGSDFSYKLSQFSFSLYICSVGALARHALSKKKNQYMRAMYIYICLQSAETSYVRTYRSTLGEIGGVVPD